MQVVYEATPLETLDMSDRLLAILGRDLILVVGHALQGGAGGLMASLTRLQQAAAERREAAQVKAAEAADDDSLSLQDLAKLMDEVEGIDAPQMLADMTSRFFGPEMRAWKADLLRKVTVDGEPLLERPGLRADDLNTIVWQVTMGRGLFPLLDGLPVPKGAQPGA